MASSACDWPKPLKNVRKLLKPVRKNNSVGNAKNKRAKRACVKQRFRQMGADEAGAARDECPHV